MVQRTRLAVILLVIGIFTCICTSVSAQEIPRLIASPLSLPQGWTYVYDPPAITIRVAINPDSTLSLISILGPQQELRALVQQYLLEAGTSLVIPNAFSVPSLRDVSLDIAGSAAGRDMQKLVPDLRAQVDIWILQRREQQSPFRHWNMDTDMIANNDLIYHSNYNAIGIPPGNSSLRIKDARLTASIFSDAIFQGYFHAFYEPDTNELGLGFGEPDYPYAVTITDLQAGMGDYEQRFARLALKKNELLGVKGMYYAFDLLAANGWWAEANAAQSSMRHLVDIPLGPVELELEYADFSQDAATTHLRPAYWQSSVIPVSHDLRILRAAIASPWLDVSATRLRELSRSTSFATDPRLVNTLFRGAKDLSLGRLNLRAAYEYADREANVILAPDRAKPDYEQLLEGNAEFDTGLFSSRLNASWYDWDSLRLQGKAIASPGVFRLGAAFSMDTFDPPAQTSFPDIYNATGSIQAADIRYPASYALLMGYRFTSHRSLEITFGRKSIQAYVPVAGSDQYREIEALFAGLNTDISIAMGDFRLEWKQELAWTEKHAGLLDRPVWMVQGDLRLTRYLPWDNALFAGVAYTGHTGYTSSHASAFLIQDASVFDAYLGIRISKLFEINAAFRNITDSAIFGVQPIPPSVHASIRWFYLN